MTKNMDISEIKAHARTMQAVVKLLNQYSEFLFAPSPSPQEDQAEKALTDLMEGHSDEARKWIVTALLDIVVRVAEPEPLQEYLNDVKRNLEDQLERGKSDE